MFVTIEYLVDAQDEAPFAQVMAESRRSRLRGGALSWGLLRDAMQPPPMSWRRAVEIGADAILKATKVDGVYDKDPMKHKDAKRYDRVSHAEALQKRLGVMDAEAFSLCEANKLPIIVLSMSEKGAISPLRVRTNHSLILSGAARYCASPWT